MSTTEIPLNAFARLNQTTGRLMGLDLGTKTIGIAISDSLQSISTGLETIKRTKFKADSARLQEIIEEQQIIALILGLPLNMDGSEGPRAQSTRAFARNVSANIALPLIFWDERLSTVAAERALIEADSSRKRRKEVIDKMAATIILQGALDRLQYIRNHDDSAEEAEPVNQSAINLNNEPNSDE